MATAHGESWRTKRKEANALFSRSAVEAPCAGQVNTIADYTASLSEAPQDAIMLARRFAAMTSSRGILGRAITLEEADRQIAFSKSAADRFNAEAAHFFARANWMLAPWRRELAQRKLDVFPIVQSAIDECRTTEGVNDGLMTHFVQSDFISSNDRDVLSMFVGLLMGAQDNIAAAVAWIFAFLAQKNGYQEKIRAEVAMAGSTAEDLRNCAVLSAFVFEVLRVRPAAPANQPRVLTRKVNVAGHELPKGTFIFNSFYNMHHDAVAFAQPEVFDPGRFLGSSLDRSPGFAPFGHGPRNCVAQGMAVQQLRAVVAGLLRDHIVVGTDETLPEIRQLPFLVPAPFEVEIRRA